MYQLKRSALFRSESEFGSEAVVEVEAESESESEFESSRAL